MVYIFATMKPPRHRQLKLTIGFLNGSLLGDVEAVQELSDVLVLDGGRLLDEGRGLRDGLQGVSEDDQLVLLVLAVLALDAFVHLDFSDVLLAQEVSDLNLNISLRHLSIFHRKNCPMLKLISFTQIKMFATGLNQCYHLLANRAPLLFLARFFSLQNAH